MANAKISEWSQTAGSNTEIDGVALGEGVMTPSQVNNAIRELMSQVAELYAGASGDRLPVSAGGTGSTSAAGARTNLGIAADPTTTRGDLYTRDGSAAARLPIGAANTILGTDGTDPVWRTVSAALDQAVASAQGSLVYRNAANWVALAPGTSGQFLKTQGAGANPAWDTVSAGWTVATAQATTSGTAFDFTGISSAAKQIAVLFNGVSLSGSDNFLVQLGDSGGVENSGYVSASGIGGVVGADSTAGFIIRAADSGATFYGILYINLFEASSFTWTSNHVLAKSSSNASPSSGGGYKALSAALDRVRLTRTGTDTFDAGSVTVAYI